MAMKYLVLGSAGQIGAALVKYLKSQGGVVEEFDLVNSPAQDLRIFNNQLLEEKMPGVDFVMFLAFDVGGSRYLKTYQHTVDFLSNNTLLMENTFSVLKKFRKPFIFASSQMSNMSYSPYGVLKALGEAYAKALGGLVVKFWNVYGVEHDPMKAHVITDFIFSARKNRKIDMLTDGKEQRQFLYADDCSECLSILAERYNKIPRDRELHITNFKWNSILEVAQYIAEIFPGTKVTPAVAVDEVQKDRRNEPDEFILNYWKPRISLSEGIKLVATQTETEK
jgi:nucleoside-diphosphate-sugar epimerase